MEQMGICFEQNTILNNLVRKIKGVKWSKTNNCWYVFLSRVNYKAVAEGVNNAATIDSTALKEYLEKREKIVQIKKRAAEKSALQRRWDAGYRILDAG